MKGIAVKCSACQARDIDESGRCPHCDFPCVVEMDEGPVVGDRENCPECRSVHAYLGIGPRSGAA